MQHGTLPTRPVLQGSAALEGGRRSEKRKWAFWIPLWTFTVAIGLVVLVAGVRFLLDPLLGDHHPFILFLAAAFLASWYRGWKAGALALGFGLLAADFLFVHPRGSLGMWDTEQRVGMIAYGLVGASSALLIESLKRAQHGSEARALALRQEIAEHHETQEALRRAKNELEHRVERRNTQLSRANGELRESETRAQRAAALVGSSEDAIIGKDLDGRITDWNTGAEHLFGYSPEEAIGRHCSSLFLQDADGDIVRAEQRLRRGEDVPPYETVRRTKDGRDVPVSARSSPIKEGSRIIGLSTINRDLRIARELQEQLRQAQKMEAVGQLAGGVAHDFNNLLTIITGYSEMLLGGLSPTDPRHALVEEIRAAGERAAALTRQLLLFSRKQVLDVRTVNLNATVEKAGKMLHRLIGEDVQLVTVSAPDLASVKIDLGQVEQVLMNLAVNARDAMPAGGKLTIEMANVELDAAYAAGHLEVRPGPYVRLAVSDTGCGMDKETQRRIFDPFFTTKEVGKGTGLGLAVVHGIVKLSGGGIGVYSEPGHGTTFKIYLPAVPATGQAVQSRSENERTPRGTETVLLVEDEEAVRRLSSRVLQEAGYTVMEAAHGAEAVRIAHGFAGPIHLLVSDVVMPEMGGRMLAERLTAARTGLKVLYCSGYTDNAVIRHGILHEEVAFLQKPFTPGALAQKVREVLDAPNA